MASRGRTPSGSWSEVLFTNIRDYPLKCVGIPVNFSVKNGSAVFTCTKMQNAVASFVIILGLLPLFRNVWRLFQRQAKADEDYIAIEPIPG